MKCTHCFTLNTAADTECSVCHQELVQVERAAPTPQWAYFFAVACGAIPIIALGGLIPAALGVGGAGSCLKVSRVGSLPLALRLLLCLGITAGCWFLFVLLVAAVVAKRK